MSTLQIGIQVVQLGTLSPAVNQQITQAVTTAAASATAATASATAAGTSATASATAATAAAGSATTAVGSATAAAASATAAAQSVANPPVATQNVLGAVKIGANLATAPDGTLTTGVNSAQLPRYRIALAKTLSGQANTRVLCLGDSTTFGVGSTNSLSEPGPTVWKQAYPQQLALALTAAGIPASCNGAACANPLNSWNSQSSDARWALGSAWSLLMGTPSLGGGLFQASGAGGPLGFTPAQNCDSFRVWYVQNTGLGTVGLAVGGGTVTNQSTSGATGYVSATKTGTLAANTLNMSWISGLLFLSAVEAWNSAQFNVQITNAGWPGGKLSDISTGTGFGALAAAIAFAPDLYVVSIGINDWENNNTPLATFTAELAPFLNTLKAKADVVLVTPPPSSVTGTGISNATQQAFVQAMHDAAQSVGIPFVDNWTRFGTWDNNQAMYGPGTTGFIHPNMIGYSDFCRPIARVLTTV